MPDVDIAAYKEAVFGSSTQSSTTTEATASAESTEQTAEQTTAETSTEQSQEQTAQTSQQSDVTTEVVDADEYAKGLGYESWEKLKEDVPQLKQFKETAPKPIEYANEESKKVHELLLAGKVKEVKAIYDLQERLESVDTLTPAEKIKLHIEQTNKHYKKADIEDVFEEKYTYPEKPVQGDLEEDDAFAQREERYKAQVEKIDRRIERDSYTAAEELSKLKQEIKLPEIPSELNSELEQFKTFKQNQQVADEKHEAVCKIAAKISEQDVPYKLNFNDEAKKVSFEVTYQADKEGFDKAKETAFNHLDFSGDIYQKQDGSPDLDKIKTEINGIYKLQNFDKIVTEAVNQAVNETLLQVVRNQKNIGDGFQRNFNMVQPDAIQKLKEQVFGN